MCCDALREGSLTWRCVLPSLIFFFLFFLASLLLPGGREGLRQGLDGVSRAVIFTNMAISWVHASLAWLPHNKPTQQHLLGNPPSAPAGKKPAEPPGPWPESRGSPAVVIAEIWCSSPAAGAKCRPANGVFAFSDGLCLSADRRSRRTRARGLLRRMKAWEGPRAQSLQLLVVSASLPSSLTCAY